MTCQDLSHIEKVFYLSTFYKRNELASRVGLFYGEGLLFPIHIIQAHHTMLQLLLPSQGHSPVGSFVIDIKNLRRRFVC